MDCDSSISLSKKRKSMLKTSLPFQKYTIQNGVDLSLKHCFALSSTRSHTPIQILFDDQLIFVVGNYIVIHNLALSQEQTYIELESNFSSVGCIATESLPTERKALLAYSDFSSEVPYEASAVPHKKLFEFASPLKSAVKPRDALSNSKELPTTLFRGRVAIIGIGGLNEKHILSHFCAEPFEIKQIELTERKYCYVLCENDLKMQVIHIWNFEKDVHMLMIDLKQATRMFCINPKNRSQVILDPTKKE